MEKPTRPIESPARLPGRDDIEARVQRIISGLLPETAFRDTYGAPASLAEGG